MPGNSTEDQSDNEFFDISKFLLEYEKLPELWDKNHEHYRNKLIRFKSEEELGEKLNISAIRTLRKKIRSVRGSYNAVISRVRHSLDTGSEIYVTKLRWFPLADRFLRVTTDIPLDVKIPTKIKRRWKEKGILSPKNAAGAMDTHQELHTSDDIGNRKCVSIKMDDNYMDEEYLEELNSDIDSQDFAELNHSDCNYPADHKIVEVESKGRRTTECQNIGMGDIMTYLRDLTQDSHNEFAVFGRSVGMQLQNMPKNLAIQVQRNIQDYISKVRLQSLQK